MIPDSSDIERSSAIVQCAGYRVIPLAEPIGGVWHVLAVNGHHLLLVAVSRGAVATDNVRHGHPHSFPSWTTRLIHRWHGDEALPAVQAVS